jgi:formate dehydrogenase assembly factor FdhD
VTLVGFVRGDHFNIYTHERRIRIATAPAVRAT